MLTQVATLSSSPIKGDTSSQTVRIEMLGEMCQGVAFYKQKTTLASSSTRILGITASSLISGIYTWTKALCSTAKKTRQKPGHW